MNDLTVAPPAEHSREYIENKTFDEIKVGDTASLQRALDVRDIQLFAIMSGDVNPAHVDPEYAASSFFHEVIAHGMWGLVTAPRGTKAFTTEVTEATQEEDLSNGRSLSQRRK